VRGYLQRQFDTMFDFTKLKDKCLFCGGKLRVSLTNYIGSRYNGLPVLNATIESGRFVFNIKHTTQSYHVEANGVIDILNNKLVFDIPKGSDTPHIDERVAKQALDDLRPHIELSCDNRKCKSHYHLSSTTLDIKRSNFNDNIFTWVISPLKLFIEGFKTHNFDVQSDQLTGHTYIFSNTNENADPIIVPIIDFDTMGADKLLNRISTIATFS
jgi:hypothetical protein